MIGQFSLLSVFFRLSDSARLVLRPENPYSSIIIRCRIRARYYYYKK